MVFDAGKDLKPFVNNPNKVAFNSCALFISDNLGTQIDGLGHIAHGEDAQIYNGFKIRDVATDFGLLKQRCRLDSTDHRASSDDRRGRVERR